MKQDEYEKGFKAGVFSSCVLTCILIVVFALLSGCTPYVFGGLGYAGESGKYRFDEQGELGVYGIGVEFEHNKNFVTDCEYIHRSMIGYRREVVTNDVLCRLQYRFEK